MKVKFSDLRESSQRALISQELAQQNGGTMPQVTNFTIGKSPYDNDPDGELISAQTEKGQWLLVWSSEDKEFTTVMKENQNV